MTIVWIPSGFPANQKELFFKKVDKVTEDMWKVNWFKDHKDYFDVYRLEGDDDSEKIPVWDIGGKKTAFEIKKLIRNLPNGWGDCNFLRNPVCKIFPSVIINELSVAGGATKAYFYIGKTAGKYEFPHEWGHEGFADCLCDEYEVGSGAVGAHWCRNLDDISSNRKWEDFIGTKSYEGGNHRHSGIFRPTRDSIMRSPGSNPDFDALGYEAMNKGLEKRYGKIETRRPSITCNILEGDIVSQDMTVRCDAQDASGIEMVVFYLAKAGDFCQSFGLNKAAPYEAKLDISEYEEGNYYLRCVAWDKNWNWQQYNPRFTIKHKIEKAVAGLNIPLHIREVGNVDRENDVISSGVPLPMGLIRNPENIRVVNAAGKSIPAQFKILERWIGHDEDRSIKWLLVTFLGDVPAGGKNTYFLKTGKNPQPENPLKIKESANSFTIGNTILKKDFSDPLQIVFTDAQNVKISASQLESIQWNVVESGPVRVCLKAENSSDQDPFGFIAWFYFYAGLNRYDMSIVLKNTPRNPHGPLYFKDFSIELKSPASEYAIGKESDNILSGTLGRDENIYLYQASSGTKRWDKLGEYSTWKGAYVTPWNKDIIKFGIPDTKGYIIADGAGKRIAQGGSASGWVSKKDISLSVRHFAQQFPKALEVSKNTITARLWPKYWQGHGGLHWLDDMQRKSHDLTIRRGTLSPTDAIAFNHPLVIHCGLDWYRRTNVFGYIDEKYKEKAPDANHIGRWEPGWVTFGGDYNDRIRRRYHEYPMINFIRTGDPFYAYRTQIAMKHTAAVTPFWIDDYAYPADRSLLRNSCYCCPLRDVGTYHEKTAHHGYMPWNPQHWTAAEIFDGWRLFGDPLAYDAIEKTGVFLQFWVDYRKEKGINETRLDALPQNALAEAYKITQNPEFKKSIHTYVDIIWDTIKKDRGYYAPNKSKTYPEGFDKSFMLAYLAEGLNESYSITHDERIIDMITGLTDYIIRESYIHPCYAVLYESPVNLDVLRKTRQDALASSTTKCDCSEYKWGSDAWKDCSAYRDWRILSALALSYLFTKDPYYADLFFDIYQGGSKKRGGFHTWNPLFDAILHSEKKLFSVPEKIINLQATRVGIERIKLTWTSPGDAARYQVKYSWKLIIPRRLEIGNNSESIAWWAAQNVSGEPLPKKQGSRQSMIIDGIKKGQYYFAIRSYSENSGLSELSNVIPITITDLN